MPFASDKQRKYLYANKPEVANKLSKKHIRRNMPVHFKKEKPGTPAHKKAVAEHNVAIKKKKRKGGYNSMMDKMYAPA